jgi:hypothetical protein
MQKQTQSKPTYYSKTIYHQGGGFRRDRFSWYSDEDISENEQQWIEKKPTGKL